MSTKLFFSIYTYIESCTLWTNTMLYGNYISMKLGKREREKDGEEKAMPWTVCGGEPDTSTEVLN